jgi:uncharacterized protein YndB with AHSA1/START domain
MIYGCPNTITAGAWYKKRLMNDTRESVLRAWTLEATLALWMHMALDLDIYV